MRDKHASLFILSVSDEDGKMYEGLHHMSHRKALQDVSGFICGENSINVGLGRYFKSIINVAS